MIVIREIFRINPERIKDAREFAGENKMPATRYEMQLQVLMDLAAEFYSIIFCIEAKSFDEYLKLSDQSNKTLWQNSICMLKSGSKKTPSLVHFAHAHSVLKLFNSSWKQP